MQEDKVFEALLGTLNESDYNNLIKLEELHKLGYSFEYTLDTNVIRNYCFPRSFSGSARRKKIENGAITYEYLSEEQVTLHLFLNKENRAYKVYFFDQYVRELHGLLKTANIYSKQQTNDIDDDFNKLVNQVGNDKEFLKQHFSNLIASILLNIDGLQKYRKLFKEYKILLETEDNSVLSKILLKTKLSTDRIGKIGLLYRDFFKRLRTVYNESSKERDATVIERIILINKEALIQDRKVLLLVTDSISTRRVFDMLKDESDPNYPSIQNRNIAFCITIGELFAYLICSSQSLGISNYDEVIRNIESLKIATKKINSQFVKTARALGEETISALMDEHPAIFDNYRSIFKAYANSGLLKSFDIIYNSIRKELDKKELHEIRSYFTEVLYNQRSIIKEVIQEQGEMLMNLKDEVDFNTIFFQSIQEIKKKNQLFDLSPGSDDIKASYQHLPILFKFSSSNEYNYYYQNMEKLANLVLTRDLEKSQSLCNEIESLLKTLSELKPKYSLVEKIIRAFIFLLLPPGRHLIESGKDKTDYFAFKWLEKIVGSYELEDLESDVWYMYCWAARRNENFSIANKYARLGIERYPSDPRFYHGKALVDYCNFKRRKDKTISQLDHILQNLKCSQDLYPNFITTYYNSNHEFLNSKIQDCLSNAYCFLLSEKARILREDKHFEQAKANLVEARYYMEQLKDNNVFHEELHEYYGTESHLYYLESEYEKGISCINKLKAAVQSIVHAIFLSNIQSKASLDSYEERREKIINRLNSIELL